MLNLEGPLILMSAWSLESVGFGRLLSTVCVCRMALWVGWLVGWFVGRSVGRRVLSKESVITQLNPKILLGNPPHLSL